jgi:hypothetical protein
VSAAALTIPSTHDIHRQPRDTEGIGTLKLLSALDLPTAAQQDAGEADSVDELIRRLTGGARASLENPSRLHGLRTEAMFRAVLVALGTFQLLVEEDEGQIYYEDAQGPVKLPDYRVVDSDGHQLLVEVKTVPPNPRRLRHSWDRRAGASANRRAQQHSGRRV